MTESHCRTCMEPITAGAKKCLKCKSYQDWRRFINSSETLLALVVALVSVVGVVTPVLVRSFTPNRSNVKASYYLCGRDKFQVVASNLGNRVAVLRNGSFQLLRNGNLDQNHMYQVRATPADGSTDGSFIYAGKSRLFQFTRKEGILFPGRKPRDQSCFYELTLNVVGFDHAAESPEARCACPPE